MFEKFTEKAINVLTVAQTQASAMNSDKVYPEHLLLGLLTQKACLSTKLLSFSGIKAEQLYSFIEKNFLNKNSFAENIVFSDELKEILKKSFDISRQLNNSYILTEHLFLALLQSKNSNVVEILKYFNFDIFRNMQTVIKFLDKKKKNSKNFHPESLHTTERTDQEENNLFNFNEESVKNILKNVETTSGNTRYKIIGTEQIIQSILTDFTYNNEITSVLVKFGLTQETFNKKLKELTDYSEDEEKKQILLTPNALKTLSFAIDTAKEMGSVSLKKEHILIGLLKAKQGLAYDVIKSLNINTEEFYKQVFKPIEKQMPETLTILRLAKQEARRLGRNILGTEMILLGILGEGVGVGAVTLAELGVTLKDARVETEDIVGYGDEYNETQMFFTERAKKIIEKAWEIAKTNKNVKINSEHLLEAITTIPDCVAMRVLINLGADIIEIKQGILKFLRNDRTN